MVIRLIGLSVVPAGHVGVLESAFVPSQLQIAKALLSIYAWWKAMYLSPQSENWFWVVFEYGQIEMRFVSELKHKEQRTEANF